MAPTQHVAPLCILACVACMPSQPQAPGSSQVVLPSGEGPGLPAPEVWLTPVDLTTGTGPEVVPRVAIMNSGMPLGGALDPLIRNVSLRSWPSLVRIEAQARVVEPSGSNPGQPTTIDMVPTYPLADGWYVLAVTDLPEPFRWPRFQPVVTDARIGYAARFRTSSSPFPASVRACAKERGKTEWIVDYSELVAADTADGMRVDHGGVPCERATVAPGTFVGTFTSICASAAGARVPVNVRVDSGFVSASGARALPLAVSLFADAMEPAGPGCTIVRLPPD